MNDYARGALDALVWMDSLIAQPHGLDPLDLLKREVQGAKEELLQGSAIDFRARLRAAWAFK